MRPSPRLRRWRGATAALLLAALSVAALTDGVDAAPRGPVRAAARAAGVALSPGAKSLQLTKGVPFTGVVGTFTDSSPGPINDDQAFVEAAYPDLLGRPADAGGLGYWLTALQRGTAPSFVTSALTSTDEWARSIVAAMYPDYLSRPAGSGDLAYWSGIVRGVGTDTARASILGSQEYFGHAGATFDGFITALYDDALHRVADSGGRAWADQQLSAGVARSSVAATVVSSDEAHARRVEQVYAALLDRPPSSGERTGSVALLRGAQGERALSSILVSLGEYRSHLPNVYSATASWAGGPASPATVRRASGSTFEVLATGVLASVGTFDLTVQVSSGDQQTTIPSTVTVIPSRNERWLDGAYQAILGRNVDPGAVAALLPALASGGQSSRTAIASGLLSSVEANTRLARSMYQDYLHRTPGASEASYWASVLASRAAIEVRSFLLGSEEYFNAHSRSPDAFVDALYLDALGRPADGGGHSYYVGRINQGDSRSLVALALLSSVEAGRLRTGVLYPQMLGRPASASDRAYWGALMAAGIIEQRIASELVSGSESFEKYPSAS